MLIRVEKGSEVDVEHTKAPLLGEENAIKLEKDRGVELWPKRGRGGIPLERGWGAVHLEVPINRFGD